MFQVFPVEYLERNALEAFFKGAGASRLYLLAEMGCCLPGFCVQDPTLC